MASTYTSTTHTSCDIRLNEEFDAPNPEAAARTIISHAIEALSKEPALAWLLQTNPELAGHWTGSGQVAAQVNTASGGKSVQPGTLTFALQLTLQAPARNDTPCTERSGEIV
jgi:hypothetical protein